jgi:thiol-disulfide isomerase/thioredoxin
MTVLETRDDLQKHLENTPFETTILKLTASWCTPCKKIAPYVKTLNTHYSTTHSFEYIEVDVDESLDLYAMFKKMKMANGVPTFLSFKKANYDPSTYYVPFQGFSGASPQSLEQFYRASLLC